MDQVDERRVNAWLEQIVLQAWGRSNTSTLYLRCRVPVGFELDLAPDLDLDRNGVRDAVQPPHGTTGILVWLVSRARFDWGAGKMERRLLALSFATPIR